MLLLETASCYLIASSTLEACSDSGTSLNCTSSKLVASISLDSDQMAGTETLEAYITAATSQGGGQTPLQYPVKVTASKSRVTARYPLRYQRDFNNKVRELVLSESAFQCSAEAYSSNPTCGWKLDPQGAKIWDSQGYCCTCSFLQTIGLDSDSYTRGNQCQALNLGEGYATAHCLVMDELWYSAYQVGKFGVEYEVEVKVTIPDENGNYTLTTLHLSPSVAIQQGAGVVARLIGDFYPSSPPPVLESLLLFTPSQPPNHSRVLMGSRRWMLINNNKVSYDGTECNKVGTSYSAFANQPNQCAQRVQSCFQNQLDDFDTSDLALLSALKTPLYLLPAYGNFTYLLWNEEKYLQLTVDGRFSTLLTIELNADRLVFVTSVSTGRIDYAFINTFESLSYDGLMTCQVTSTGKVVAQFSLTVNCTEGIAPVPGSLFTLPAGHSTIQTFSITTEKTSSHSYNCSAQLWDALGTFLEAVTISFNTTTRHTDLGPQGGTGPIPVGDVAPNDTRADLSCTDYCPNWFDVPCFFVKSCWTSFLRFIGIIVLLAVVALAGKFVVRRYGWCCQRLCPAADQRGKQPSEEVVTVSKRPDFSPTYWSKSHVYYNFHYGIPELGVYQQFSARGTVRPVDGGEYEFIFEDRELGRFLREKKRGETLRMGEEEVWENVGDRAFYGEFRPVAGETTDIER